MWRNPLGTALLYGALASHLGLALWSLYQRQRLRMSLGEAVQLLLGLAIPPFLTTHVVGTRLAHAWFDVTDSYTSVVLGLWVLRPDVGVRQVLVVLLTWLHGCLGMYFWLALLFIEEMTAHYPFLFLTAEWALCPGTCASIPRYSKTKRRTMTPAP